MSENTSHNTDDYFDQWVDKLIIDHKNKLNSLKSEKVSHTQERNLKDLIVTGIDYYPSKEKRNPPIDFKESFNLNLSQRSKDLSNLRISKLEKMLNDSLNENSQMKLKIKEMNENIEQLNKKNCYSDTNAFLERENDLIETIKLLKLENQRLEKKLSDVERNNKDKQVYHSQSEEKDYKIAAVTNKNNNQYPNQVTNHRYLTEGISYEIKSKKLEKVIDIFLSFFERFNECSKLGSFLKDFNYEEISSCLQNFRSSLLKTTVKEKCSSSAKQLILKDSSIDESNNDSKDVKDVNTYLNLEQRLEKLENSVSSLLKVKNKEPSSVKKITPANTNFSSQKKVQKFNTKK